MFGGAHGRSPWLPWSWLGEHTEEEGPTGLGVWGGSWAIIPEGEGQAEGWVRVGSWRASGLNMTSLKLR